MNDKKEMREELRVENPDMSDEQFEAEWAMIDQLGLVVEDEVDGDDA